MVPRASPAKKPEKPDDSGGDAAVVNIINVSADTDQIMEAIMALTAEVQELSDNVAKISDDVQSVTDALNTHVAGLQSTIDTLTADKAVSQAKIDELQAIVDSMADDATAIAAANDALSAADKGFDAIASS